MLNCLLAAETRILLKDLMEKPENILMISVVFAGSGGLATTQEVRFGTDGNLLVSGRGDTHILKYNGQTGAFIGNLTSGYDLDNPTKMTSYPMGKFILANGEMLKRKLCVLMLLPDSL